MGPFPFSALCFKTKDRFMLHLASSALLQLRVPAQLRSATCAMPVLALCEAERDRLRWGDLCPLRPCQEAAPLLARCASRRRLWLPPSIFSRLTISGSVPLDVLISLNQKGELCGLDSCRKCDDDKSGSFVNGAVVCVFWCTEKKQEAEMDVAVIGILG